MLAFEPGLLIRTEDQLISRFLKELEGDQALKRAVLRDVFNDLFQELGEGKPPKARGGLAVPRVTPTFRTCKPR
jgi:hypothetical protein